MISNIQLETNVKSFIEKRLQASYTDVSSKREYKKVFNQYFVLLKNIQSELSNKKDLLEQYETKEAEVYEMQLKQAYKTGFKDCMEIFISKKNDSV